MASEMVTTEEGKRAAYLLDAQTMAAELFGEIEKTLIRSGVSEKTLSDEIHEFGAKRHGVRTHWHRRTVRSGPNTLLPYAENRPDRIIQADDILFVDLGPVFEAWEADFGRTFVLEDDTVRKKLKDSLSRYGLRSRLVSRRSQTCQERSCMVSPAMKPRKPGMSSVASMFPHERIPKDKVTLYLTIGNDKPMRSIGAADTSDIGFWRFISWIGLARLVVSWSSC